ncbi:retrovirus-related pol polyprotein from transposon TNT 1-94 [Tanacetum coccineum]
MLPQPINSNNLNFPNQTPVSCPSVPEGRCPIECINHMRLDDLEAYDSDCDELNSDQDALMEKLSRMAQMHLTVRSKTFYYKLLADHSLQAIPGMIGFCKHQNSKKHDNSDYVCINGDDCMSSDNLCVSNSMNDVKFRAKSKKRKSKKEIWKPTGKVFNKMGYIWRPTGRTFTIVGNACPLTRITTTNEVPSRKPIVLDSESPKPVVKLVYSRKPRKNKNTESVSKTKVVQIVLWYLDSGCSKHMTGDRSQLTNFISKFLGTVKFGNDQVAKIMGYGDYQIGNVTISRVYYVEGLGHNLFSVGQFCDSNLEVAFRQHTCFIRNLEGVDLLTGSRGDNLYTLSLGNMMASSPICLLSKASKTKSWLWHRRLSHLNFGAINHLARHGLVRGLPKLKFEKDHLCSACALGKSSKKPHKPKSEDTNQEKLYLLHMDLCGPMRVASVQWKEVYPPTLSIDYSVDFTWVKCLRSKDEAPAFIINFLKMIQVRLKETVRPIRTDNETEYLPEVISSLFQKKFAHEHAVSTAHLPQLHLINMHHYHKYAQGVMIPNIGIPIPEVPSDQSSSSDVNHTIDATRSPTFVAHMNMVIYQMDVKTAFQNGNLREEGLKQAPRRGMICCFILEYPITSQKAHCSLLSYSSVENAQGTTTRQIYADDIIFADIYS